MYPDSNQQLSYETDEAVYFFSGSFDPLNNWSAHAVEVDDRRFPTVEHAFHYYKFIETAPDVAQQILNAPSPWAAMQIERKHGDKRRKDWQDVKVDTMLRLIRAKVAQNKDVADCLLATASKRIVENSPWDMFWGCGVGGKGQNQMGQILEKIRAELVAANAK